MAEDKASGAVGWRAAKGQGTTTVAQARLHSRHQPGAAAELKLLRFHGCSIPSPKAAPVHSVAALYLVPQPVQPSRAQSTLTAPWVSGQTLLEVWGGLASSPTTADLGTVWMLRSRGAAIGLSGQAETRAAAGSQSVPWVKRTTPHPQCLTEGTPCSEK